MRINVVSRIYPQSVGMFRQEARQMVPRQHDGKRGTQGYVRDDEDRGIDLKEHRVNQGHYAEPEHRKDASP
jgi:hypothetical protein